MAVSLNTIKQECIRVGVSSGAWVCQLSKEFERDQALLETKMTQNYIYHLM